MTLLKRVLAPLTVVALGLASMIVAAQSSQATAGASRLTVTVTWAPGLTDRWTLKCDPVGGSHPNRSRACALLDSLDSPFAPAPAGMACTMVYSGPERARVIGTWQGKPVDARFSRNDGCATARWHTYRALFTESGVVTVGGRVDLGPTCPVQRPDENCEIVGADATVSATSGSRHRSTSSGSSGFSMRVPRGVWTFTANAGMSCPEIVIDARKGHQPAPVVISCDTGIRASIHAEKAV